MAFKKDIKLTETAQRLRERLSDAFDVNYEVAQLNIDSMDAFEELLLTPFLQGVHTVYRGERICSASRRLVPTLLRSDDILAQLDELPLVRIDSEALLKLYSQKQNFMAVYEILYGKTDTEKLYKLLAFAQHYLDLSPFIDFSHSLYVALSFAMKGRQVFDDDIVIYTAFDIGDDDTTCDETEVNAWLKEYSVNILHPLSPEEMRRRLAERRKAPSLPELLRTAELSYEDVHPTAKLIDIPTNDLMKYQQGVFLLLNNFSLIDKAYLTKAVRQSFVINKYCISKDICPELQRLLKAKAPQYRYECLLDISRAVKG